ncbi:MAG TPA: hypothetical protein VIL86_02605 [Tepidisphaeraceae bacterium]
MPAGRCCAEQDDGAIPRGVTTGSSAVHTARFAVNTNASGVNTNASGVNTNASGVNTNASGVDTKSFGVDTERLFVHTERLFVDRYRTQMVKIRVISSARRDRPRGGEDREGHAKRIGEMCRQRSGAGKVGRGKCR